jgi:hypothetical protein
MVGSGDNRYETSQRKPGESVVISNRLARISRDPKRLGLPIALAVLFLIGPFARAQDSALGPVLTQEVMLKDRLIQLATFELAGSAAPRPDQVTVARMLFDLALGINAEDAEAWRMRAELATMEGKPADREKALKQYISLVPDDDAAQFDLVMMRVGRLNTLEERLSMIERILGSPSAKRLSAPLRSRLSAAAAMAAREMGQKKRYLTHLKSAVSLDPANPTATSMTHQYIRERSDDPLKSGALLVSVVKAAPMDASARIALAYTLAEQSAYRRAADQFETAARIGGGQFSMEEYRLWALSLAAAGQDDDVAELLDDLTQYLQQGEAPRELPVELELIRLATLDGQEEGEAAEQVFKRIVAAIDQQAGENLGEAKAKTALIVAAFIGDQDRALAALEAADAQSAPAQVAQGWLALRAGDLEEARQWFNAQAESQPLAALGLAVLAGTDETGNVRALIEVMHDRPTHVAALLAARVMRAEGRDVPATGVGDSLIEKMDRSPNSLWVFDEDGPRWTDLRMEIKPLRTSFAEPIVARITLRNRAQFPLSIGNGPALPARLAYQINATISGQPTDPLPLTIADAARRLTLAPGESFSFETRLDRGSLARALNRHRYEALSFSTLAVLDPRALPSGAIVAGLLGDTARSAVNQAWGRNATEANIDRWLEQLDGEDETERIQALGQLAGVGSALPGAAADDATLGRIAEVLNDRYKQLGPQGRAWVLLYLGARDGAGAPTQPILDAAKRSDEPVVRIAYLLTQARDPQSPQIAAGLRHGDRLIRDFASAWQVKLQKDLEEPAEPTEPEQPAEPAEEEAAAPDFDLAPLPDPAEDLDTEPEPGTEPVMP